MQYIPRAAERQRKSRTISQLDSATNGASTILKGKAVSSARQGFQGQSAATENSANQVRRGCVTATWLGIEYLFSCSEKTSRLLKARAH